ncbi:MAG: hypothetical protein LBP61_05605 [Desulfovibrio sp.]|jgi:hypothetical protein|nr:hypothetical protein [Desulfovibrio sp.]
MLDKEYLQSAAKAVERQLADFPPSIGIPVDPDVADQMGTFVEDAISPEDMADDVFLNTNEQGEVSNGNEY